MTDKQSVPRSAALKDLEDILAHAANHPAERQKLADAPRDALQRADFLRSLGSAEFDEAG